MSVVLPTPPVPCLPRDLGDVVPGVAGVVVGWLAERGATRTPARTAGVMVRGNLAIYAVGVPWLMAAAPVDLPAALGLGVVPFLIGDAVKVVVAAGLLPATWRLAGRR